MSPSSNDLSGSSSGIHFPHALSHPGVQEGIAFETQHYAVRREIALCAASTIFAIVNP